MTNEEREYLEQIDKLDNSYYEISESAHIAKHRSIIDRLEARLSSALSLSSAYREALEKLEYILTNVYAPDIKKVRDIARQALDRKPEEPVEREELREIIKGNFAWLHGTIDEEVSLDNITDALLKTFRVERR